MNENVFLSLYMLFIFLIMQGIIIFTPNFTRKEIIFGVKVPKDKINMNEIKKIRKQYIINNLIIGIPIIIIFVILIYNFNSTGMILFTTFAIIFIDFLIYLISNRAMKKLKAKEKWFQGKKQSVTIDTSFSRDRESMLVSPWLFLIPVFIILINVILGYSHYSVLPDEVPVHWDFSGNITGYQKKSLFLIWTMPLAQIFCTLVFFLVYKGIGWSKQQISSENPEISLKKNRIFRWVWSIYMVVFCIFVVMILTMGNMQILNIFNISYKLSTGITIVFLILIFASTIVLSTKLGQGGANLKLSNEVEKARFKETDRDDDKYWKIGNTIYYNPEDPSLFIEKRFGIGWTINAGRPLGMAIYIGIIILTIGIAVFASFVSK
ncbi:DUF1648 domain-containing protein [Clostridium sp. cel8]|jgi:uncharacterized membrane protein|uniref:DUF1648 domain-containing protein n=1 Tax=unclassified Clostridium TaxID=2614128 RepID=UPI0015F4C847|nr:DUF1648 domain-containing protein [Clostridium sp. cel8]MBA5849958.1 DUF1648 domain-containing protein [Clostridium sp. cel8]